jgi:hypothetical protein
LMILIILGEEYKLWIVGRPTYEKCSPWRVQGTEYPRCKYRVSRDILGLITAI